MDIGWQLQASQKQQMVLMPHMLQSLEILKLSAVELSKMVDEALAQNPLLDSEEYFPSCFSDQSNGFNEAITRAEERDVCDELYLQLHLAVKDKQQLKIGEFLIESLDDSGFLREDLRYLAERFSVSIKSVLGLLKTMQQFEPVGVFSRNIKEYLLIQLKRRSERNICAEIIVRDYLTELANNQLDVICLRTGYSIKSIRIAIEVIKSLNPRPINSMKNRKESYIIPEIKISAIDGVIKVEPLNSGRKLRIHPMYKEYQKYVRGTIEEGYIKSKLDSAKQIISSIDKRCGTLLAIARLIARHQEEYFLNKGSLIPLTYAEIADEMKVHISTVSRAVSQKSLQFGNSVYPLKHFFPAKSKSGEPIYNVKEKLCELIKTEDKSKPLSDSQIMIQMQECGIILSRRTVAKYRQQLNIKSASFRKEYYCQL